MPNGTLEHRQFLNRSTNKIVTDYINQEYFRNPDLPKLKKSQAVNLLLLEWSNNKPKNK